MQENMSKGKSKEESTARFMIQNFKCEGLEMTQLSSRNALRLLLVRDDCSNVQWASVLTRKGRTAQTSTGEVTSGEIGEASRCINPSQAYRAKPLW